MTPASQAVAELAPMTVVPMPPTRFQKAYKKLWKKFERSLREEYGRGIGRTLHSTVYSFSHEQGYDSFERVQTEYIANIEVALIGNDSFETLGVRDIPEQLRALNARHANVRGD